MRNQHLSDIQVANVDEISRWENVFRVLGIKRCQPLLRDVGLPTRVINDPKGLVNASYHFWQVRWSGISWQGKVVGQGYSDPGFPENYRLGIQSLLADIYNIIASKYNEADAMEIYRWSQCHFINRKQVDGLYIWSLLLPELGNARSIFKDNLVIKLSLSSASAQRIVDTWYKYLGPEIRNQHVENLAIAKKIPLSSFERRMIQLEVTGPTDMPEVDVLEIVEQVLRNQQVYQFWSDIDEWISDSEKETLLWWGYEQAASLHIPIGEVALPDKM